MVRSGETGALVAAAVVIALVVLTHAGHELIGWNSDKNAWAEQQCQDSEVRFELCVQRVSSRGAIQVVGVDLIILGVIAGATLLAFTFGGMRARRKDTPLQSSSIARTR